MKDIKTRLKEAREAIKNKDYETSLKVSKIILKEDKANYMALIFLGLSLQEVGPSEQAPKAFQKAIEINPTNCLAWNGLINYYEKVDSVEAKKELIKLYTSAVSLEGAEKKIIEYCEKLAKLCDVGDFKEIVDTIFNCIKLEIISNKNDIHEILVKLFQTVNNIPSELETMYEKCLLHLLEKEKPTTEYYSTYLTLLYKKKKYDELLVHAEKMYNLYNENNISLVWICKIFNESFVEESEFSNKIFEKVAVYYAKLLDMEPKNAIGLFSKSIMLLKEGELVQAKDILVEVTSLRPGLLHAWVLLTRIYIKLNLYEDAKDSVEMSKKLLKTMSSPNQTIKDILDISSMEILSKSSDEEDWDKALQIYENIEDDNKKKCLEFVIRANLNLQKFLQANLLITDLKPIDTVKSTLLHALLLHKQKKLQEAVDILENYSANECDFWMEIGLLYWDMGEYKKCLVPFLKAAKCNPNNYFCFLNLGHYYQKFEDFDKARRCYEKALKINPQSREIGTELCKVYRKLQNWEATQSVLQNITSGTITPKNSWAWLQLGLSYLEQGDYSNAIDNLRYVVRIQPENVHSWEALADAYLIRGSYTSALKCYEKSLELAESTLYPLLQIATIKKILGHFPEARIDFEKILLTNGQYVPALKGLAETCMYQARECYNSQRIGTARDNAQVALEKLILAIQQKSELSCLWKLLADSCLFVAKLPEKFCCMLIPKSFIEGKESEGNTISEKEDLYNIATRSYCKAISLLEDNILIWHDLGTCYLYHAINTSEDNKKAQQLFNYALAASQYCTSNNPSNWQHWNLLGNVAMKKSPPNYALAQHAFIKAVTVDHNCASAWTNLGLLYLLMNNIKLANKAFAQGQRSDPNYVNSWIGQALIAETMGHEEAMDLFRHSTQLGQQQQGGLGYGHWVCQTLLKSPEDVHIYSIRNMHAIPVACDALTWYTEKNPYDGCAWNMLGILSERMKLKETTLKAYKNAYRLSERKYRDLARINYGRILAKLERYSEAINIFQEVEEATFNSGSGLALALFKDQQFEESYSAYEQALHWLTEEQSSQSELLVALASMAYMFQGIDTAKTLLFQSIQLKPPSSWSLYSTLALALLHKDLKLAKLVSNEIEIYKDKKECLKHYAILKSYTYLLQGNHDKAIKEVSKLIHKYPENPSLWLTLSVLLLRMSGEVKSYTAAKCAQSAMIFGQTNMDVTKILCLVSQALSLAGNNQNALVNAQKAVHCYPNVPEGWAVLVSSLKLKQNHSLDNLRSAMTFHIGNLNPSKTLLQWVTRQK